MHGALAGQIAVYLSVNSKVGSNFDVSFKVPCGRTSGPDAKTATIISSRNACVGIGSADPNDTITLAGFKISSGSTSGPDAETATIISSRNACVGIGSAELLSIGQHDSSRLKPWLGI